MDTAPPEKQNLKKVLLIKTLLGVKSHMSHSDYRGWRIISVIPNIIPKIAPVPPHAQRARLLGALGTYLGEYLLNQ